MSTMTHNHSSHEAHNKHAGHHTEDFLKKFWVTLILTIPILAYSELPQLFFGWSAPAFLGSEYIALLLGSIIFFYGGWIFIKGALGEIKARLPGMMTLIALAITAAYSYSVFAVLLGMGMNLFWELATLIAVMLIGHWIEMRAVVGASGALKELAKLLPDKAEVLRNGQSVLVALSELKENDIVLVKPGAKIPADGTVLEGQSEVNESVITGESKPVGKNVGDAVIAGAINGDGSLQVRVTSIGEKTFLAGVMRLVTEAEASKSRLQLLSDRAAAYLTYVAIGAGVITFVAWVVVGGDILFSVERLVAVLVIACPHALGLAIPLVAAISTTMAAKNGFLIRRRLSLEVAKDIDIVLFDKTGTLTKGAFAVTSADDTALRYAAAVEAHSEHPIGKAIVQEAKKRNLEIVEITDFTRVPGRGAEAVVGGKKVFVGHRGGSDIVVEVDGTSIGTIALADEIRPEAKEAVDALKAMGVDVAMITGDSKEVAAQVAAELGIEQYFARVRPEEKSEKVKLLQAQGKKVAMVGDGVNDAPALTQANVGVAIGAGTNVAIESAGIILVKNDPRDIVKIIKLSQLTYAKMIQNLFWATGYNILALPVAAGALAVYGIMLEPAVAAVFMSASTVIVAINASLLRNKTL
jgi:P-type Cu2+ transporter